MKQQQNGGIKMVEKRYSDYTIGWILIILKAFVIIIAFVINIYVRKVICPFIVFPQIRRYVQSVVNLMSMRVTLIMLGFFGFQCNSFGYFNRGSPKLLLKSGYIGIGTHKSILDFLYYSYLYNPVFVKIIIYKKQNAQEIYYSPLSFIQSVKCAFDYRGFDPIIVHNDRQFKNIKYRKLAMKTLISQCFEELYGPVFILLPGLDPKVHISLNPMIAKDIFLNEVTFQRSLIGFSVKLDSKIEPSVYMCRNQTFVFLELMSRFTVLKMSIAAIEFRKWKHRYDKETYSSFIDKYYSDEQYQLKNQTYEDYLLELNMSNSNVIHQKIQKIK